MTAPAGNGTQRRALREFGGRLVDAILTDDEGMAVIVEAAIRAKIDAGELIEADKLVLGGATVIRAEELAGLRAQLAAFDEGIYNAQVLGDSGDYRAAMAELDKVRPPDFDDEDEPEDEADEADEAEPDEGAPEPEPGVEAEPEVEAPEPEPGVEAEPEVEAPVQATQRPRKRVRVAPAHVGQVQERNQTGGGSGAIELTPSGRPKGMPDTDQIHSCDRCDDDNVDGMQAAMSWTRTREKLCRKCLATWKDPVGGAEPDPVTEGDEPVTTVA